MALVLDPSRQERAAARARRYEADATYHETQAKAARASITVLCNTWSLDPVTLEPQGSQEPDSQD